MAHDFGTELWTLKRVRVLIERLYGVRFSEVRAGRLLGAMGFSSLKPERRAIERDETAVLKWKRKTWPALKKRCRPAPSDRLHRRIGLVRTPHPGAHLGAQRANVRGAVPLQLEARLGHRRADTAQHKSRIVRENLDSTHGAVPMALLPGYAPDLNPVE